MTDTPTSRRDFLTTSAVAGGLALAPSLFAGQSSQLKSSAGRNTPTTRVLMSAWKRVAAKERELLSAVTFADLARQLQAQGETMYHI